MRTLVHTATIHFILLKSNQLESQNIIFYLFAKKEKVKNVSTIISNVLSVLIAQSPNYFK